MRWHELGDNYMEPAEFRATLNHLIQELRNVTFLLQKQKAELDSFSEWYTAWITKNKDDRIMRWVVKSRNRIVKESDLETYSRLRTRHSVGGVDNVETEWRSGDPLVTTRQIAIRLLSRADAPDYGFLTIDRSWIDRALPDDELMSATRAAYVELLDLIATAHRAMNVEVCDLPARARKCVTADISVSMPDCMSSIGEITSLNIDLATREEWREKLFHLRRDDEVAQKARQKYGDGPKFVPGDALDNVDNYLAMALSIVAVDPQHVPTLFLFKGSQKLGMFAMPIAERSTVAMTYARIADEVAKTGADNLAFIVDQWMREFATAKSMDDMEILMDLIQVFTARANGDVRYRGQFYRKRGDGQLELIDTPFEPDRLESLELVRKLWKVDQWNVLNVQ